MRAAIGLAVACAVAVAIAGCGGTQSGVRAPAGTGVRPSADRSAAPRRARRRDRGPRAPLPRPIGSFAVGVKTIQLSEPAPAANATGTTSTGQPVRELPTTIRYPAVGPAGGGEHPGAGFALADGPFPLLVFSQGFDTSVQAYASLLDALASAGYVVAAPIYPDTDPSSVDGVNEADMVNHPADLRFVLENLLASRGPLPSGLLDKREVALIGQSDGGDVSLAAVANSCCLNPSVDAAVILSGAEWAGFGGRYFSARSVPLLVVQGSADTINLPGCSAQLYDQASEPKYYLDLLGAEHLPPYIDPGAQMTVVQRTAVAFLNAFLKRGPQPAVLTDGTVDGVATITSSATLPGAPTDCPGAP